MPGTAPTDSDLARLDDPVGHALASRHAALAVRRGRAARYPPDVSPFGAMPLDATAEDWSDAAELVGPDGAMTLLRPAVQVPGGWALARELPIVQMVASAPIGLPSAEAVRLAPADGPAMLDLAQRTAPGPFGPRTGVLGTYLGVRRSGQLVAMAGERLSFPGWTELSAICTLPEHRGRGLATHLMRALAVDVEARGDRLLLHVLAGNAPAIGVYERLGFEVRRDLVVRRLTPLAADVARVGR